MVDVQYLCLLITWNLPVGVRLPAFPVQTFVEFITFPSWYNQAHWFAKLILIHIPSACGASGIGKVCGADQSVGTSALLGFALHVAAQRINSIRIFLIILRVYHEMCKDTSKKRWYYVASF